MTRALSILVVWVAGCSRFGPVYPSRPDPSAGPPIADPEPARVVAHVVVTSAALREALDDAAPRSGEGTFAMLGSDRHYGWDRGSFEVSFSQGRVVVRTRVHATVALPIKSLQVPLDLRIEAEPIVSSEYAVKLQSVDVRVTSADTGIAIADRVAGIYDKVATPVGDRIKTFSYDLKPLLSEAYARLARPIEIPVGEATACARLRVLEVEAGPTVLADGIEKDIALVVAPSITMPCIDLVEGRLDLPPLSNVATLVPGPFTVTIPIAARYDELTRALASAFTDGKLYFSRDYPRVFLEKPELYESQGQIVLRLHISGPVRELGIDADLDGDLYLVGHPAVIDNELSIPDLEPTIETRNFLLSLKAIRDADQIRDQARHALRLDIGSRLRDVRDKLGVGLTFSTDRGCFKGDVDTIQVASVHPHAAYLRVYVSVTARARLMMPCAVDVE